jgi:TRAP-type mannitol/chloroaromatic compound transport system permease small subunit
MLSFLKKYILLIDQLNTWIARIISIGVPLLMLILCYEIISRYFFDAPTIWAFDLSIFVYGYMALLGGAYVLKCREHITVDIFYAKFSPRNKALSNVIGAILIMFFLILLIIYGGEAAIKSLKLSQRAPSIWAPPIAHFKFMIPISAGLLIFQLIANTIRDIYMVVTNKPLVTSAADLEGDAHGN